MEEQTAPTAPVNCYSLPGAGRREEVLGTTVIYKLESKQTDGKLACYELIVPPGYGIPPHVHRDEDENFYVLSGLLIMEGDDLETELLLEPGALFHSPHGRYHGFRCDGPETAKILIFVSPGASIEAMLGRLDRLPLLDDGGFDYARVAQITLEHGIRML
jgi:quercetin dioxygenase-like cupin family protein